MALSVGSHQGSGGVFGAAIQDQMLEILCSCVRAADTLVRVSPMVSAAFRQGVITVTSGGTVEAEAAGDGSIGARWEPGQPAD
jgi:hypothetical protein